ncbi:hypothetical protein [Hoylesella saccharolytica]|uniref:hypothetical protein n=1 Tax=Hoylesella saccharolytica TaxID=633701 RepID=UPI0028E2CC26|nr:hypothetical protein [Hoylesella saccharolytica]
MKKLIVILVMLLKCALSLNAMSYEQARRQALFLTDKMAYELNLTEDQYEAAYEINLDYLISIDHYADLYGIYWRRRNTDLRFVLFDWQYRTYCITDYFYWPLCYEMSCWRFRVYARYPHRDYYYFGQPSFYKNYCGAHSWQMNGNGSWYNGRQFGRRNNFGMRDCYQRVGYSNGMRFAAFPIESTSLEQFGSGIQKRSYTRYDSDRGQENRFGVLESRMSTNGSRFDETNSFSNSRFGGCKYGSVGAHFDGSRNNMSDRPSSTRITVIGDIDSETENLDDGHFWGVRVASSFLDPNLPNSTFSPSYLQSNSSSFPRLFDAGSRGGGHFGGRR